jgi:pimeloyl-ACP methyl ester carboxylesterase
VSRPFPHSSSEPTTATIEMIEAGGRTLRVAHWRLAEPSDHPPILFFNGIGANIEALAPLAERLTERGFVIFDMPGTGESPDPSVPYNPATISWTATRVLDRLGLEEVDVMGMSWGGAIAQHFALQHPGRTRRVVLVATTAGMLMIPGSPVAIGPVAMGPMAMGPIASLGDLRRYVDPGFMNEYFLALFGGTNSKARGKIERIGRLKPPSPLGFGYQLLAMMGWTSLPALPFLDKEVLIMMGGEDGIVPPANGEILAAAIRNSRLEVFEGGGHLFLLTHGDESVACLRAFLDAPDTEAERKRAA